MPHNFLFGVSTLMYCLFNDAKRYIVTTTCIYYMYASNNLYRSLFGETSTCCQVGGSILECRAKFCNGLKRQRRQTCRAEKYIKSLKKKIVLIIITLSPAIIIALM